MAKIIFDSAITGHHTEYISHLIDYIKESPKDEEYIIVVPENIKTQFPEIVNKVNACSSIKWDYLPLQDIEKLYKMSLVKRAFVEYSYVNAISKKYGATHVLLMYFNIIQFALIFKRPTFNISGILFLQFYRMEKDTIRKKIKYWRKYWVTKMVSKNPKIIKVFILNDKKTVEYLNKQFRTEIFKVLPDPIPDYEEDPHFNPYKYYKINLSKKILLHVGGLDYRKGTLEIIESIDELSKQFSESYAMIITGKANKEFDAKIIEKIKNIRNKNFKLVYENTFISNEKLMTLFKNAEIVLIPYKNPEASSGILGYAMKYGKKVIAPANGLLGEIVSENNLGMTLNYINQNSIAQAINILENSKKPLANKTSYNISINSKEQFAKILLNN